MKTVEKLNEMLDGTFLTCSSRDRLAAKELINEGIVSLGRYQGSGKYSKTVVDSVDFLHPMVIFRNFNDAPRGGKIGEMAELIKIDTKLVNERYKEFVKKGKKAKDRAKLKAKKRREEIKLIAKEKGFSSVSELKRENKRRKESNAERLEVFKQKQLEKFEEIHGRKCNIFRIRDRVMLSKIDVEFDRPLLEELI